MSQIATLTLTGLSGRQYNFGVYKYGTNFKPIGVVYAVTHRNSASEYDVIYIGQTEDLSDRFDNHHKESCFIRNNVNCICVHTESNENQRLRIEQDLTHNYNPPCNG